MLAAEATKELEDAFELAWEVLEVARVIAEKHFPDSLRLSDIYISIGDVCLESGA